MKALVLEGCKRFAYKEVPTPAPADGEVLVAGKACGLCGSDVHGMDGSTGRRRPPIIMGHAAAGSIVRAAAGVPPWGECEGGSCALFGFFRPFAFFTRGAVLVYWHPAGLVL